MKTLSRFPAGFVRARACVRVCVRVCVIMYICMYVCMYVLDLEFQGQIFFFLKHGYFCMY